MRKALLFAIGVIVFFSFAGEIEAATLGRPANNLGLVGYWPLDEATSTTAGDFSGKGNVGTTTNMAHPATATSGWTAAGKHGAALNFDGTDDYLSVNKAGTALAGLTNTFTVTGWFRVNSDFTSSSASSQPLVTVYTTDNENFSIALRGTDYSAGSGSAGQLQAKAESGGSAGYWNTSRASWKAGQWYFVTVVVSTTAAASTIYINGVADTGAATGAGTFNFSTNTRYFGWGEGRFDVASNLAAVKYLAGSLDDVRIYNRALTAAQIAALYKSGEARVNSSQGSTVTNGLVGRWTFDGKDVNWTSATAGSAYDISGSNNNGTLTSMNRAFSQTAGKLGQAFLFDGTDDYVNLGSAGIPTGASAPWTIALWAKPTVINSATHMIMSYGDGSTNGASPHISITTANQWRVSCWGAGNDKDVTSPTPVIGQWNHIVGTYDGTNIRIYVNGTLTTGPSSASCTPVSTRVRIGASPRASADQFFGGSLDDVRIYNRAITAAEVKTIYNEGAASRLNTSSQTLGNNGTLNQGLVGLWTFDGADITTSVADRSGIGNNGYYITSSATIGTSSAKTGGKLGQALNFYNADNTAVYLGTPSSLNITGAFTIAAWVKPKDFGGSSRGRVYYKGDGLAGYGLLLNNFDVSNGFSVGVNTFVDPEVVNSSASVITLNVWQHVVATRDSSGAVNMYVNGVSAGTGSLVAPGSNSTFNAYIGRRSFDTARNFEGAIDDVRIYNRALTAAEVKALYNMGK